MNIDNLKSAMETKKINITELSKKASIGQSTVSEILSGVRKDVKLETAKKIANVLDVTLDELCKGE